MERCFYHSNQVIMPSIFIHMWQLSNKLHKIRSDIRKEQISSIMRKERAQLQRSHDEELINELVSLPIEKFGNEQLKQLVQLANKDLPIAIAYLGNLTIDRILNAQVLSTQIWKIGNDEKWSWLINVFAEIGFCTPEMLQHCIKRIITKKSVFSLENALQALQKVCKLGPAYLAYFRQSQLVLALGNHTFDSSDKVAQPVFTLLTTASSEDQQLPKDIFSVLGQVKLNRILLHGLMKIQTVHRALSIQIANNFLLSGISLRNVHHRILELALNQRQSVKLQISYYLKAFAEKASEQSILFDIKQYKLMEILQNYKKICSPNPRYDTQISTNALHAQSQIIRRFSASTQSDRMTDQSSINEQTSAMVQ